LLFREYFGYEPKWKVLSVFGIGYGILPILFSSSARNWLLSWILGFVIVLPFYKNISLDIWNMKDSQI
jgi:hypothetical protein